MRQLPGDICPLFAIANTNGDSVGCIKDRCAWWSFSACACGAAAIADYLSDAADSLQALTQKEE